CGRLARHFEFIAMHSRMLAHMIDDQDLVRQIEDEVALILGARQSKAHRLELEDEVVAERAIEAEMLVLGTPEQIVERAQHREDARLPAALFLREERVALSHLARDMVFADITELSFREAARCAEAALWKRNSVAARVTRATTSRLCAKTRS